MKSKAKDVVFDDDKSLWDVPFRPSDTRGLAQEIEHLDAIARRARLTLPLEKRMNVLHHPLSRGGCVVEEGRSTRTLGRRGSVAML